MKIKFCGANNCITGSSHLLCINDKKILLDCGLFQGKDCKKHDNGKFLFDPKEISVVILSHAHIDHSGRILELYKNGFKGKIVCTKPTVDLCKILLDDCENLNGIENINDENIKSYFKNFIGYDYEQRIDIDENISIMFKDAGHILGSAICEIMINNIKVIYSGDIGNEDLLIINDPNKIYYGDYLILEGTYGDKIHNVKENEFDILTGIIKKTVKRNGNVVIPAFSLGRTQEIIYTLNKFMERDKNLKDVEVYVDSPMASKITEVFEKNKKYFDKEAKKFLSNGDDPLEFKNLHFIDDIEISKNLKNKKGIVIIASSGDCKGGRVIHHIRNNIEDSNSSIVFVCAQGNKTLGKEILQGKANVSILNQLFMVKCYIYNLQSLSGHADKNSLINWVCNFKRKPKKIFLVHGEKCALCELKDNLEKKGFNVEVPSFGEEREINS